MNILSIYKMGFEFWIFESLTWKFHLLVVGFYVIEKANATPQRETARWHIHENFVAP